MGRQVTNLEKFENGVVQDIQRILRRAYEMMLLFVPQKVRSFTNRIAHLRKKYARRESPLNFIYSNEGIRKY